MEIQKEAKTKEELVALIEQLDTEEFVSIQIEKQKEKYIIVANKINQNLLIEEVEERIKAYIKKKNDYGVEFILEKEEDEEFFVSLKITMGGKFNLPWGDHYRLGSIDCYVPNTEQHVEEYRLTLYSDLIGKEKLVELSKSHQLLDAWRVGAEPLYHVYSYRFEKLDEVFSVIESLVYPK